MLTHAVRLIPEHFDAQYNLGIVLNGCGRSCRSACTSGEAVQLDPSSTEARFRLAGLLRSLGLHDEAQQQLAIYQRNIKDRAKKDVAATKANQANQYLTDGNLQKAVDTYREAVAENPNDSHILFNLALALDRKEDYPAEREVLQKATEVDPGFALAHNQLGFLSSQADQMDEAEKEFKTARFRWIRTMLRHKIILVPSMADKER